MFFVLNKEKVKSYLISVTTVVILLMTSIMLQNNNESNNVIATSNKVISSPINIVEGQSKKVSITINCAENMDNVDEIIDILSKMKCKVTFFVTGEVADKNPTKLKKIISNGHEIGSLSNKYKSLKNLKKEEVENNIKESNQKIQKAISMYPKIFRAPYGEYNDNIMQAIEGNNMQAIGWNIDTMDYNELKEDEIIDNIEENISGGSIILMNNQYIVESLEGILKNITEKGFECILISELIK